MAKSDGLSLIVFEECDHVNKLIVGELSDNVSSIIHCNQLQEVKLHLNSIPIDMLVIELTIELMDSFLSIFNMTRNERQRINKNIPILLLCKDEELDIDKSYKTMCFGYLERPFSPSMVGDYFKKLQKQKGEPKGNIFEKDSMIVKSGKKAINKKILIFESYTEDLEKLTSKLRASGYSVTGTDSGFQAISLLENEQFDLLICDVDGRDMGGLEVCALSRLIKEKEVSILLTSKRSFKTFKDEAVQFNIDAYHTKPYQFSKVIDICSQLL